MVDGLIELRQPLYGVRNERRLLVHKLRESGFLEGEHAYHITRGGVAVFPRIEALLATPTHRDPAPGTRVSSGIDSFDAMLGDGIPRRHDGGGRGAVRCGQDDPRPAVPGGLERR